jgi:hypothetical protein
MGAYRVVRRRGSQIAYTIGSQMAEKLSSMHTGRALLPRNIRLSKPQGLVQLEGLGELKKKKKVIHFIGSRTRNLPA